MASEWTVRTHPRPGIIHRPADEAELSVPTDTLVALSAGFDRVSPRELTAPRLAGRLVFANGGPHPGASQIRRMIRAGLPAANT